MYMYIEFVGKQILENVKRSPKNTKNRIFYTP